jgi:hypothetical protein
MSGWSSFVGACFHLVRIIKNKPNPHMNYSIIEILAFPLGDNTKEEKRKKGEGF